ncbi:hypothetical protein [uncultured Serinicoccus sp.]|uniref:hypothetical protein n=1 Tax=uncultured Serinicoccus sp. TaxID=735514 RepID=UPI002607FBD9|nr:hypothetical protein [uncultured Serinicoccus sp.]
MRVAAQLGLDDPHTSTLLSKARARWASWAEADTRLAVCGDPLQLPDIFTGWSPAQKDEVLQALSWLASPKGGDQVAAAGVLSWLLIPGAARLAVTLAHLSRRIDEVVAAQLWIEARSWNGGPKVAANVLMRARGGVLRDLGIRDDPAWSHTSLWDTQAPESPVQTIPAPVTDRPAELVLRDVLQEAIHSEVITGDQRDLLLHLARAADAQGVRRAGRGNAGLLAEQVLVDVGRGHGMHRSSVRRHAARSLGLLREHARQTGFAVSA